MTTWADFNSQIGDKKPPSTTQKKSSGWDTFNTQMSKKAAQQESFSQKGVDPKLYQNLRERGAFSRDIRQELAPQVVAETKKEIAVETGKFVGGKAVDFGKQMLTNLFVTIDVGLRYARGTSNTLATPLAGVLASVPGGATPRQAMAESLQMAIDVITKKDVPVNKGVQDAAEMYRQSRGIVKFGEQGKKPNIADVGAMVGLAYFDIMGDILLGVPVLKTLKRGKEFLLSNTLKIKTRIPTIPPDGGGGRKNSPYQPTGDMTNYGSEEIVIEGFKKNFPEQATLPEGQLSKEATDLVLDTRQATGQEMTAKFEGDNLVLKPKKFIQMSSPNVEENLTFEEATKRLNSPQQASYNSSISEINKKSNIQIRESRNVVGDTKSYGTENAIIEYGEADSENVLRYIAAQKGKVANQKTVLNFIEDSTGGDNIYIIDHNLSNQEVRLILDKNGLEYRTIDNANIVIYDEGKQLIDIVNNTNKQINGKLTTIAGKGEFIGGETRAAGLESYNRIISDYEKSSVHPNNRIPQTSSKVKPPTYKPIKEELPVYPEIKTSRLALGVEEKAIKKKLVDGFEGLPEYATVNVEQQAKVASQLLKDDIDKAIRIALGKEIPPEGLLPESVFVAVENQALKTKNVELLQELATNSNLSTEATGMGQRLRMLAERNPNSPVKIIREVSEARKAKSSSIAKNEVNKLKAEVVKPKRGDWEAFIKSIKC